MDELPRERPVCVTHPDKEAEHVCTRCGRWQCSKCVRRIQEGVVDGAKGCAHCHGIVKHGELARPADTHQQLLLRQLSPEGIGTIVVLSLPAMAAFISFTFLWPFLIVYLGALSGYYYQTIDHIGRSRPGLPFSSGVGSGMDILLKLGRGMATVSLVLGPALFLRAYHPGHLFFEVLLLLIGLALAPASVVAAFVTGSTLNQFNPPVWVEIVRRAPRSYGTLCLWIYGSTAIWAATTFFLYWLLGPMPVARTILVPIVNTIFVTWQASLFGLFLQREAERSFGLVY